MRPFLNAVMTKSILTATFALALATSAAAVPQAHGGAVHRGATAGVTRGHINGGSARQFEVRHHVDGNHVRVSPRVIVRPGFGFYDPFWGYPYYGYP